MTAAFTAGYEAGKHEGYEEGYSAGWEAGRKAAAVYHDKEAEWWREEAKDVGATDQAMITHADAHKDDAAAIRELKKP